MPGEYATYAMEDAFERELYDEEHEDEDAWLDAQLPRLPHAYERRDITVPNPFEEEDTHARTT